MTFQIDSLDWLNKLGKCCKTLNSIRPGIMAQHSGIHNEFAANLQLIQRYFTSAF